MREDVLDNFVWQAIRADQSTLAEIGPAGKAGRFRREVSPFCGLADESVETWADLAQVLGRDDVAILMGPRLAKHPDGWACLLEEVATQWVSDELIPSTSDCEFLRLGPSDVPEMLDLTARTEPGPFLQETIRIGRYWGHRRDGKLVAMAGERMRAGGFVEVSAVCVDPSAQRRGLGAAATLFVAEQIRASGGVPMLHVREGNDAAVSLYARLGFRLRTECLVYVLAPPGWEAPESMAAADA
ncbi:MAG: GNAT family N-acetyltransferase [bacterium]|nr:GNAT family N-acetyltransferase [bacterium]